MQLNVHTFIFSMLFKSCPIKIHIYLVGQSCAAKRLEKETVRVNVYLCMIPTADGSKIHAGHVQHL